MTPYLLRLPMLLKWNLPRKSARRAIAWGWKGWLQSISKSKYDISRQADIAKISEAEISIIYEQDFIWPQGAETHPDRKKIRFWLPSRWVDICVRQIASIIGQSSAICFAGDFARSACRSRILSICLRSVPRYSGSHARMRMTLIFSYWWPQRAAARRIS